MDPEFSQPLKAGGMCTESLTKRALVLITYSHIGVKHVPLPPLSSSPKKNSKQNVNKQHCQLIGFHLHAVCDVTIILILQSSMEIFKKYRADKARIYNVKTKKQPPSPQTFQVRYTSESSKKRAKVQFSFFSVSKIIFMRYPSFDA